MLKRSIVCLTPLILCACGGGSTGPVTVPIAAAGFAGDEGVDPSGPNELTIVDQQLVDRQGDAAPTFTQETLRLNGVAGAETITFQIGDETFTLNRDEGDVPRYIFLDDDTSLRVAVFDESAQAAAFNLFRVTDGRLTNGYFIAGFDTNPTFIADQTGSATFTGSLEISLRRAEFQDAFGSGDATMTADFDAMTVSGTGTASLDDPDEAEFSFPDLTFDFVSADIVENNFAGALGLDDGDRGGTLVNGGYAGRFFGEEGETLGATFWSQIAVDLFEDDDIFLTGYVFANQPDE